VMEQTPMADGIDFWSRDLKSREYSVLRFRTGGRRIGDPELETAPNRTSSVRSVINAGCFDSGESDASVMLRSIGRELGWRGAVTIAATTTPILIRTDPIPCTPLREHLPDRCQPLHL